MHGLPMERFDEDEFAIEHSCNATFTILFPSGGADTNLGQRQLVDGDKLSKWVCMKHVHVLY